MGYTQFFLLCVAVAVPGMLMLLKVAPWGKPGSENHFSGMP
jgi:PAT family beta-lactamase induction signal transducer AmpG